MGKVGCIVLYCLIGTIPYHRVYVLNIERESDLARGAKIQPTVRVTLIPKNWPANCHNWPANGHNWPANCDNWPANS